MKPYFADDRVELYHGDMREVLPTLDVRADAAVTDPPYGETSLAWDRWPDGWVAALGDVTNALWCFGSARMFDEHRDDFTRRYLRDEHGRFRKATQIDWKLSQDVIWVKPHASNRVADRFKRVHEHVRLYYQGAWGDLRHDTPRVPRVGPAQTQGYSGAMARGAHNPYGQTSWVDDGTRLMESVIEADTMRHQGAIHPTEKPGAILDPLIRYSVPVGGLVLDPFAGSGSTLLTARSLGRRAIGIEADEQYCEAAAKRLAEADLFAMGGAS